MTNAEVVTEEKKAEKEDIKDIIAKKNSASSSEEKVHGESVVASVLAIPSRLLHFVEVTVHLFAQPKFRVHRLTGIIYLAMFALACAAEFYPSILTRFPHLHVLMPLTGCLQAIIASLTFKFLGKNMHVQGYFSDKRTLSYDFVLENVYFSGLLLFQATYLYQRWIFQWFPPFEVLMVFFPYFTIRKLFPRTRLRDSISNDKEKSDKNRRFLIIQTWTTKVFMIFGKHITGFLINYLIFLDAIPAHHTRTLRLQLILGGWGTTIAVFLHTLKFKGYIGPRTAILSYTMVFPLFYCLYVSLFDLLFAELTVTALAAIGIIVNFYSMPVQVVYQVGVYAYLRHVRMLRMA